MMNTNDLTTSTTPEHYARYSLFTHMIGVEKIKRFIPMHDDQERLLDAFLRSRHLNTIPLSDWCKSHDKIESLMHKREVVTWNLGDTVSLLKHVAVFYILHVTPIFYQHDKEPT